MVNCRKCGLDKVMPLSYTQRSPVICTQCRLFKVHHGYYPKEPATYINQSLASIDKYLDELLVPFLMDKYPVEKMKVQCKGLSDSLEVLGRWLTTIGVECQP